MIGYHSGRGSSGVRRPCTGGAADVPLAGDPEYLNIWGAAGIGSKGHHADHASKAADCCTAGLPAARGWFGYQLTDANQRAAMRGGQVHCSQRGSSAAVID